MSIDICLKILNAILHVIGWIFAIGMVQLLALTIVLIIQFIIDVFGKEE